MGEGVLGVRGLDVSHTDSSQVVYTVRKLAAAPLEGKALELVAAVPTLAQASCSRACGPDHLPSESLMVDTKLQWYGAGSAECEVGYSRNMLVWQTASPWLAMRAGLWQLHFLAKVLCWHSLHRRSRLACSCCLLRG